MVRTRVKDMRAKSYFYVRVNSTVHPEVADPYNADWSRDIGGYVGSIDTCTDSNNGAAFRNAKRNGGIVLSDLTLNKWSRSVNAGSLSGSDAANQTHFRKGDLAYMLESSPPILYDNLAVIQQDLGKMSQIALVKAYAKMNQSDIMLGEILSDMDKTIEGFRKPFSAGQDLIKRMLDTKRRKLMRRRTIPQAIAECWLEYRYAWQPLILDCNTLVEKLHFKRGQIARHLVARGSETQKGSFSKSFADQPCGTLYSGYRVTGTISTQREVSASAGVLYEVADRTTIEKLNQTLGTRPSDMVALAWEKIPYSFVADWFVNVGDWLQAVTPNPYVTVRGNWVTTVDRFVRTCSASGVLAISGDYKMTGSMGSSITKNDDVKRRVNQELPNLPTVKPITISPLHSVDAAALLLKPLIKGWESFRK